MTSNTQLRVSSGDLEIHVEQRGSGPDVLLIAGLGDTVEVWEAQLAGLADRYRVTAFDNRGLGRSPSPVSTITVPAAASDAAAVIRELDLAPAHVMGFSGGGMIAQELAITEPELLRSLVLCTSFCEADALGKARTDSWLAMGAAAESAEEFYRYFLSWIYTREAHADGRVDRWIEEFLNFPYPASDEAIAAWVHAFQAHSTRDRLGGITAPTLVIAGEVDAHPVAYSRDLAELIPDAELVVLPNQAHQPFQEIPDAYNALVAAFWERVAA